MRNRFVVSVHDVCPATRPEVMAILDAIGPLVGNAVSVAMIPHRPTGDSDRRAMKSVVAAASETLVHGLTHCRPRGPDPFSWLVGRNDEFAGLTRLQTLGRLRAGVQILRDEYAIHVCGTLPPAWRGRHVRSALVGAGLDFVVGFRSVRSATGRRVALSTASWDPGPIGRLWPACEAAGHRWLARRDAVPCVTLHPAEVRRGLLPRGIRMIREHLRLGRSPTTFAALLESAGNASAAV